ncbi:LysE family translocator [Litoribacillus peritrichatus]|uniref:Lysine transporter LysE n=1 Tax=Litoribacillus peritrichatus TaxID=718191 RepID=A0ABP7NDW7_9GAMM
MTLETWLAFVAASLVLTMTPGPSILLGMVHSVHFGVKKTTFTALGDITANFLQMVFVAIGLGVIIANSETAFQIIKWFGVITLLYMGVKMFMQTTKAPANDKTTQDATPGKLFLSGFMVAAGNPKAIVFFTAFFHSSLTPLCRSLNKWPSCARPWHCWISHG